MAVDLLEDEDAPDWLLARCETGPACWMWTGSVQRRHGGQGGDRAVVRRAGRTRNVARVIHEEFLGVDLPAAVVVEHSCDNALCVRPSHLLLSTAAQNSAAMVARGRARPGGRTEYTARRKPELPALSLHPQVPCRSVGSSCPR